MCEQLCYNPKTGCVYYVDPKTGKKCEINLFRDRYIEVKGLNGANGLNGKDGVDGKNAITNYAMYTGYNVTQVTTTAGDFTRFILRQVQADSTAQGSPWPIPAPTIITLHIPKAGRYRVTYMFTVKGGTRPLNNNVGVTSPNDISTLESLVLVNDTTYYGKIVSSLIDGEIRQIINTVYVDLVETDELSIGMRALSTAAPCFLLGPDALVVMDGRNVPMTLELIQVE